MKDLKVGDTIPAGSLVLLTSGAYSSYSVNGLYHAKADVVIPGRPVRYGKAGEMEADTSLLSTMPELEEVEYFEVWRDE